MGELTLTFLRNSLIKNMEIDSKYCLIFISILLVFITNANTSPTPNLNRLLRLRDSDRGIGNGADRNLRRNSRNLWKVIGRSHFRREENDDIKYDQYDENKLIDVIDELDTLRKDLKDLENMEMRKARLAKILGKD